MPYWSTVMITILRENRRRQFIRQTCSWNYTTTCSICTICGQSSWTARPCRHIFRTCSVHTWTQCWIVSKRKYQFLIKTLITKLSLPRDICQWSSNTKEIRYDFNFDYWVIWQKVQRRVSDPNARRLVTGLLISLIRGTSL